MTHCRFSHALMFPCRTWFTSGALALAVIACTTSLHLGAPKRVAAASEPLRVVTTLPDFASIARFLGGERVEATSLASPANDPHFLEAKPSFVKLLSTADVLAIAGMDLEAGYVPALLQNARNSRILPGQFGYVDCSAFIERLEVPTAPVDRSMGDVHPFGNPHYWLDPINGLIVAENLAAAFSAARPADRDWFQARLEDFRWEVSRRLVGETLAQKYDVRKLAVLQTRGKLLDFLRNQGDLEKLGGWWRFLPAFGQAKAVDDHNMWPYFAQRFGLQIIGHMEPKPGIPPTTSHLQSLVERMRAEQVRLILSSPYYDPRHARFLAEATGAVVVPIAHLTGSRPGTNEYLDTIDYNVRAVSEALQKVGLQGAPP